MSDEDDKDEDETAQPARPAPEARGAAPSPPGPLLTSELARQLRLFVPLAWLAVVIATGLLSGVELAFLVLAGGVLVLVITLMWISVQSLTGSASLGFEEALGMGAPSKAEEAKRSVLRALKDLEYERSVGKISTEDYTELSAKYRAEAKRLIQALDETLAPARAEVEKALQKRLDKVGLAGAATKPDKSEGKAEGESESLRASESGGVRKSEGKTREEAEAKS
ncbi:MAG TPA: hypothetical protein VJN18_29450 [Polyangiaceae bacterium]|nr:hypothetical protein [Polyangiaceae bacterium]